MSLICHLPNEILALIFSHYFPTQHSYRYNHLNQFLISEVLPLLHTCSSFRNAIRNNHHLWKYVIFDFDDFTRQSTLFYTTYKSLIEKFGNQIIGFYVVFELFTQFVQAVVGDLKIVQRLVIPFPCEWPTEGLTSEHEFVTQILAQAHKRDVGLTSWMHKLTTQYPSITELFVENWNFTQTKSDCTQAWTDLKVLHLGYLDCSDMVSHHIHTLKELYAQKEEVWRDFPKLVQLEKIGFCEF